MGEQSAHTVFMKLKISQESDVTGEERVNWGEAGGEKGEANRVKQYQGKGIIMDLKLYSKLKSRKGLKAI